MTEIQPAHFTQGACHTAQGDRQVFSSLVCSEGRAPGVGGEMAVTTGAGLSVNVADGNAFVEGTEAGWQGMYHVSNDASVNVTLAAADPTDDRIDLIVAQVRDSAYSGANDDWLITDVTGTPSPSPVAPTLPDNSLILATVLVEAGDTSVDAANITLGEFYASCADAERPYAVLGNTTTAVDPGGPAYPNYATWDSTNSLSPEFTLLTGIGPNDVLRYNGPTRWFAVYAFVNISGAVAAVPWEMRVVHSDSLLVDQNDTAEIAGASSDNLNISDSPLLLLEDGDNISLGLRHGGIGEEFVTSQMRVIGM